MTALVACCGVICGLGAFLAVVGWRGVPLRRPRLLVNPRALERRTLRVAAALGAAVLAGTVTGWPVAALLAGAAAYGAPSLASGSKGRAAGVARIEAVAGWAEMLRDTMAGAAGLEQAIVATAAVAPLPIRLEVATLAARLDAERLGAALRRFADEVADPTMDLVVAALVLAAEHHAQRLGDLLGSLAQAARDQATMRLRVEAGRARARTSVRVICGATGGLALGLVLLNRGYLAPYDSATGQVVLLLIGLVFATSFAWLSRMTRPTAPERFLAKSDGFAPAEEVSR